jgi:hypothetical protein
VRRNPRLRVVLASKGLAAKAGLHAHGGYNAVLDPADSLTST